MEKILRNGKLVAVRIDSLSPGSTPVIPPEEALQVLTLKHKKGRVVDPHVHIPHRRVTDVLQECLVVIRGRIVVSLFEEDGSLFRQFQVGQGETCIILAMPHRVEFLEDSEIIEIKNGPFFDDKRPFLTQ